jgi:hypothetical protein
VPPKKITIQDVSLIIAVAVLGVFLMLYTVGENGGYFTLSLDGDETTYSLSENKELTVSSAGYNYTITVQDGAVSVSEADCPDKVCVKTGAISRTGQTVVCIPGRLILTVGGDALSDDALSDGIAG